MVAVPAATAVTSPALETVATAELDDTHVEELVTFWVVPSVRVAVAVSGLV
jgi:hypothetical protein